MLRSLLKRGDRAISSASTATTATTATTAGSSPQPGDTTRGDDTTPAPWPGSEMEEELHRLRRENKQLRRELADANYRIRQLEENNSLRLVIPDSSIDDDDSDNFSVEILSDPSATSSTTTIPTDSFAANESRLRQQQRQQASLEIKQRRRIARRDYTGYTPYRKPDQQSRLAFSTIPELERGRSSSSSSIETDESTSSLEGLRYSHQYNARSLLLIPDLKRGQSNGSIETTESVSSLEGFMRSHEYEYPTKSLLQQAGSVGSSALSDEEDPLCEI